MQPYVPGELRDCRKDSNEAVRKSAKPPPVKESPIVAWLTGAAVKQAIAKAARSLAEGKSEDVIAQVGSLVEENALLKSDNAVLRNEIASLAKRHDKVRAELDAIKRAVARGLNKEDFEFSSHRSIIDEIVGKGYGHTDSGERLLRMHAQEVVELILKKAGDDVLKQIELAAAVKDRLTDVNPNKDLPVALAIVESVKSWLKEIKNKFKGRFPNDIRSLYQGVHQAVGLADAKRADVARLLGTSSRLLKEGRARFWAFVWIGVISAAATASATVTPRVGQPSTPSHSSSCGTTWMSVRALARMQI